jgi:ABC-type long-subunit fatty acid transport system fused permease/ATPase subunit
VKGGALEGMLCEFFARGSWLDVAKAWGGLCLVVVHGLFRAWLKWRLNVWYAEFYDLGGVAAEYGSGPDDEPLLHESAASVRRLLLQFTAVVMPAIFVHPLFKWATNTWVLKWRVTLVRSYLRRWRTDARIENGAQRVHEDTSRFARGILGCCVVVLDAVLTLAVFAPVLVQLGAEVRPFRAMPDAWLLASCAGVAVVGVVGSVALGWSLIALEVANQTRASRGRPQLRL